MDSVRIEDALPYLVMWRGIYWSYKYLPTPLWLL